MRSSNNSSHFSLDQFLFFFGQSWKHLSVEIECLRRKFTTLLYGYFCQPVSYTLADLGSHGKLLPKQTSFHMQTSVRLVRIAFTKLRTPSFACHNLTCKSPWNAWMHLTQGHFQILSYLSCSLADRWDTTVDFTTSFLHSSAFHRMIFHSRPVHSWCCLPIISSVCIFVSLLELFPVR